MLHPLIWGLNPNPLFLPPDFPALPAPPAPSLVPILGLPQPEQNPGRGRICIRTELRGFRHQNSALTEGCGRGRQSQCGHRHLP